VPELDIRGILAAPVEEGVEFLLIGGVAVGFHGFVRGAKDVDIVPDGLATMLCGRNCPRLQRD
jgi:hypothetical protein